MASEASPGGRKVKMSQKQVNAYISQMKENMRFAKIKLQEAEASGEFDNEGKLSKLEEMLANIDTSQNSEENEKIKILEEKIIFCFDDLIFLQDLQKLFPKLIIISNNDFSQLVFEIRNSFGGEIWGISENLGKSFFEAVAINDDGNGNKIILNENFIYELDLPENLEKFEENFEIGETALNGRENEIIYKLKEFLERENLKNKLIFASVNKKDLEKLVLF